MAAIRRYLQLGWLSGWLLMSAASAGQLGLRSGQQLWNEALQPSVADYQRDRQRLQQGDVAGLLAAWNALADPQLRQQRADAIVGELLQGPPRGDLEPLLQWAEQQPVSILRRHEETAADFLVAVIDLPTAVADLRRQWRFLDRRAAWLTAWQSAPEASVEALRSASGEDVEVACAALRAVDEGSFERLLALSRKPTLSWPGGCWMALAERRPSVDRFRSLLHHGAPGERLLAVRLLAERLPPAQAVGLLAELEDDPELASAATLALVPLLLAAGKADPAADAALLERLRDPRRSPSTAAALARLPAQQLQTTVQSLWPQHSEARAALLFALELAQHPQASRWRLRLEQERRQ